MIVSLEWFFKRILIGANWEQNLWMIFHPWYSYPYSLSSYHVLLWTWECLSFGESVTQFVILWQTWCHEWNESNKYLLESLLTLCLFFSSRFLFVSSSASFTSKKIHVMLTVHEMLSRIQTDLIYILIMFERLSCIQFIFEPFSLRFLGRNNIFLHLVSYWISTWDSYFLVLHKKTSQDDDANSRKIILFASDVELDHWIWFEKPKCLSFLPSFFPPSLFFNFI